VEADEQQINLSRFNLFFPEKRDFFLENSGIYQFGASGNFGGGGPGVGHRIKLVYNFVAMGHAAIACEALAACARVGIDAEAFYKLVSAGGANSNMFQMVVPKALEGDLTGLQFTLGNAAKDIGYYQQMLAGAPMAGAMGAALQQVLVQANALGLGEKFVPSLIEAYGKVNGIQVVKH
jgi:2-hydroxy-3-oxopropionate reductase